VDGYTRQRKTLQINSTLDFTIEKYELLLHSIIQNNITCHKLHEWIESPNVKSNSIFIRHDVDRFPLNSLKTAQLENKLGIRTSYYFRITKGSFNVAIIKKIAALGHEIGYHYEDLSSNNGIVQKAISSFKKNLNLFKEITEIKSVVMHGKPMSKFNNKNLLKETDFQMLGLVGDAMLSIDYKNIFYFTDSGRSWSSSSPNLRDKVESNLANSSVHSTDELINFIEKNNQFPTALVTHPERWSYNLISHIRSYFLDKFVNFLKKIIIYLR
tara:strand:+ start:279 stop:1088 length:810 start_codon:yes stop_codon:yes gene_type:complete